MDGRRDLGRAGSPSRSRSCAPCSGSPLPDRAARSRAHRSTRHQPHRWRWASAPIKKLKIHEEDLRREREEAERKAALAQKRAESAERKMEVERAKSATSKFSKAVKHGKKEIGGVRGSGVRKPNYIMKKALKKAAKAREVDEG